jgi:2-(1,2-epoxy-1,2-dihydrophenyl)acetyl-CoA isomerase
VRVPEDLRELETLSVRRSARGVVTITLSRPRVKNAIDAQMWDELEVELRRVAGNPDDRVLVLTGAGGEFCSGADVSGMAPAGRDGDTPDGSADGAARRPHHLASMRRVGDVAMTLHRLPQPTIAKVRGIAAGAGLNMALLCDLVVAGETARFSEIFARRGLTIDFGGSWILPRRVGLHRAKELALLADIIGAAEAYEMGLVNRVVADDELDAFVDDWADRLAAGPPIALAMTKRLLDNALSVTMEEALDDEGRCQTVNFGTRDTAEAVNAFLAKRDPVFEGR